MSVNPEFRLTVDTPRLLPAHRAKFVYDAAGRRAPLKGEVVPIRAGRPPSLGTPYAGRARGAWMVTNSARHSSASTQRYRAAQRVEHAPESQELGSRGPRP
jgi:hypothetical protein